MRPCLLAVTFLVLVTFVNSVEQRGSCDLHRIVNGGFSERVEKRQLTWQLTYDRWYEYPRLSLDGTRSPGSSVFVSCDVGYSFQGTLGNHVPVKCSEGKWDPDPVCLIKPSCFVPKQEHGKIGRYVGNSRRRFEELTENSKIEDGEELYLRCEPNYEPFGIPEMEEKITCSQGQWEVVPVCKPAMCRGPPPPTLYANVVRANRTHGGGVVYRCRHGAKKVKYGNVTCVYGTWKGSTSVCKDFRCSVDDLLFPGLIKGSKKFYLPGHVFTISCEPGFNLTKANNQLKCMDGTWQGHLPPCIAAGTLYRNESLEEAEILTTSTNSLANRSTSTTKQPIILTTQSGNHESDADLVHNENLYPTPYSPCSCTYRNVDENLVAFVGSEKLSFGSKVKNNDKIKFHCLHFGYERLNGVSEMKCENCHSWHSSEFPKCAVPQIGDTFLQFEGNYSILPGGIVGVVEGNQLIIRCVSVGIEDFPKWSTPIRTLILISSYCDSDGRYISTLNISKAAYQHKGHYQCDMQGYRPTAFDIQVISMTSVNCSKLDDRDFIIHYEKGQAVNSTAIFFCRDKHKSLDGQNIITCLSNGQWSGDPPKCKSSPKCSKFDDMELFTLYDNKQAVNSIAVFFCKDKRKRVYGTNLVTCLPNGQWSDAPSKCKMTCPRIEETEGMNIFYTKTLYEGSVATFLCSYPRIRSGVVWTTCNSNGEWTDPPPRCVLSSCPLKQLSEVLPENVIPVTESLTSDALPFNFSLRLICKNNATLNGSDITKCREDGLWQVSKTQCSTSVNCSKFDDTDFIIQYDKGQAVNSTAIFFCRDKHKKLDGTNIITCLTNGQWSGEPPKCETFCPMIDEPQGMTISYTKNLEEGSVATFHCLELPTFSGVSRATCMGNGEWSDPPARCTFSSCSLDKLFDVVPEKVVPVMDDIKFNNFPYNFSLRLTCEDNMMLSGLDVAKCGQDGSWQVSTVQCVSGCGFPKSENSELMIDPEKNFYRFGESVSLACSSGYALSSEVVRLMCLGTAWSESVPRCLKE